MTCSDPETILPMLTSAEDRRVIRLWSQVARLERENTRLRDLLDGRQIVPDDHRALIENVRAEHERCEEPGEMCPPICVCTCCGGAWPCLPARLAEALEYWTTYAAEMKGYFDVVCGERDAAREALEQATTKLERLREPTLGLTADVMRLDSRLVRALRYVIALRACLGVTERAAEAWEANALVYAQNAAGAERELADTRVTLDACRVSLNQTVQRVEAAERERDKLRAAIDAAWDTTQAALAAGRMEGET